jgi:chemotaxis methyl-accepting protein methylase
MIPQAPLSLVLCCNLVFTYFHAELQQRTLHRLERVMQQNGLLLVGHKKDCRRTCLGLWSSRHAGVAIDGARDEDSSGQANEMRIANQPTD